MVSSLFIRVRMKKLGIIFASNNPLVNFFGSPSLKTFPRFPFCFDDSVVTVSVNDSTEVGSMLAELSDGWKFLAVGQQYFGINASKPQISLLFNSSNSLVLTNFAIG